jgi:hypothetical protein
MSVHVNEVIRKLSPADRKKVEDRAAEIIAEEMSVRGRRKVCRMAQAQDARHRSGQRFTTGRTKRPI